MHVLSEMEDTGICGSSWTAGDMTALLVVVSTLICSDCFNISEHLYVKRKQSKNCYTVKYD